MNHRSKISLYQSRLNRDQKGQIFITMLFFVIIGVTIISAEAIVLFTNILSASTAEQGANAYYVAESSIEEALLRLNRNPSYAGGGTYCRGRQRRGTGGQWNHYRNTNL